MKVLDAWPCCNTEFFLIFGSLDRFHQLLVIFCHLLVIEASKILSSSNYMHLIGWTWFFSFKLSCLIQPKYEYAQYKQISSITVYMYFIYNCTLIYVIIFRYTNWHYIQRSLYSFLDASFPNLWQISCYRLYFKSSISVSKIILRQVPEGVFSNRYFLAKHRCMQINGNRRCTSFQALICTIFKMSIILEEHVTNRIRLSPEA